MEKQGLPWPIRKIAGIMEVRMIIEARQNELFISVKTKIKNLENLINYNGVSHLTGYDNEVCLYNVIYKLKSIFSSLK